MDVTLKQLASFSRRIALPAEDPEHISREALQTFLEGWLRADHYHVTTTGILPPFAHLNGGGLFDWASDLFNGRTWQMHESNAEADLAPGEREFLVKHFGATIKSEAAITWAEENGYRAATYTEAIDFAVAHPELQRKFPIIALGSFTMYDDGQFVAVLSGRDRERLLGDDWFGGEWIPHYRFLFVRI